MTAFFFRSILVFSIFLIFVPMANSEPLKGTIGISEQSDSSWLNLEKAKDFKKGEWLRLKIGGTSKKIVVRFLSKKTDPNTPSGVDGDVIEIPKDRIIDIVLEENHKDVVQISVHGGTNPWGLFFLGPGNGSATILYIQDVDG